MELRMPVSFGPFLLAVTALCACQMPATQEMKSLKGSPFQPAKDEDGFSLLWQANDRRCSRVGDGKEPGAPENRSYRACQVFEWQTPLYNTSSVSRTLQFQVETHCKGPTPVALHLAVADSPVDVWQDGKTYRVRNARHQQDMPVKEGVALFTAQLPPSSRNMLVAIIQPFQEGQAVDGQCRIHYRIEQDALKK